MGNPKSHFLTLLFIYFRFRYVISEEKIATVVLQLSLFTYCRLVLPIIPSTASGANCRRSVCIDIDMLRLAAAACCDMGGISAQRDVLCY